MSQSIFKLNDHEKDKIHDIKQINKKERIRMKKSVFISNKLKEREESKNLFTLLEENKDEKNSSNKIRVNNANFNTLLINKENNSLFCNIEEENNNFKENVNQKINEKSELNFNPQNFDEVKGSNENNINILNTSNKSQSNNEYYLTTDRLSYKYGRIDEKERVRCLSKSPKKIEWGISNKEAFKYRNFMNLLIERKPHKCPNLITVIKEEDENQENYIKRIQMEEQNKQKAMSLVTDYKMMLRNKVQIQRPSELNLTKYNISLNERKTIISSPFNVNSNFNNNSSNLNKERDNMLNKTKNISHLYDSNEDEEDDYLDENKYSSPFSSK